MTNESATSQATSPLLAVFFDLCREMLGSGSLGSGPLGSGSLGETPQENLFQEGAKRDPALVFEVLKCLKNTIILGPWEPEYVNVLANDPAVVDPRWIIGWVRRDYLGRAHVKTVTTSEASPNWTFCVIRYGDFGAYRAADYEFPCRDSAFPNHRDAVNHADAYLLKHGYLLLSGDLPPEARPYVDVYDEYRRDRGF